MHTQDVHTQVQCLQDVPLFEFCARAKYTKQKKVKVKEQLAFHWTEIVNFCRSCASTTTSAWRLSTPYRVDATKKATRKNEEELCATTCDTPMNQMNEKVELDKKKGH